MTKKSYLGFEGKAKNGQMMKIVGYRNSKDIDVQFEDGTIVYHKELGAFKKGQIGNPNKPAPKCVSKLLGRKIKAVNGQYMECIEHFGKRNLTVRFEDGTIVKNVDGSAFSRGQVKNPSLEDTRITRSRDKYLGRTNVSVSGQKMTIVEWIGTHDVVVEFEDGTRVHTSFGGFNRGCVENPNYTYKDRDLENRRSEIVGMSDIMVNGLRLTITDYNGAGECKGIFEDGTERTFRLNAFKRKNVKHPSGMTGVKLRNKREREGMEFETVQGLKGVVLLYKGTEDVLVRLNTGVEKSVQWSDILSGRVFDKEYGKLKIRKKGKIFTYKDSVMCEYVFTDDFENQDYYICKCLKCDMDYVVSVAEMEEHILSEKDKKVLTK